MAYHWVTHYSYSTRPRQEGLDNRDSRSIMAKYPCVSERLKKESSIYPIISSSGCARHLSVSPFTFVFTLDFFRGAQHNEHVAGHRTQARTAAGGIHFIVLDQT